MNHRHEDFQSLAPSIRTALIMPDMLEKVRPFFQAITSSRPVRVERTQNDLGRVTQKLHKTSSKVANLFTSTKKLGPQTAHKQSSDKIAQMTALSPKPTLILGCFSLHDQFKNDAQRYHSSFWIPWETIVYVAYFPGDRVLHRLWRPKCRIGH